MMIEYLFRRFAVSPLPFATNGWAIPLRLMVGLGFMQHGYAKLARGPDDFIGILHAIGVPFATLLGGATIAVELVGGLFILIGAFVPLAAVPMNRSAPGRHFFRPPSERLQFDQAAVI